MDDIDVILQKEYAAKRAKAERLAAANLARARKVPAFVKLEKIEKELEFEYAKTKAEMPKSERVKQLADLLKNVRKERLKILTLLGMTEGDLRPKYSCLKCYDTGFVNGKMCDCYRARKTTEMVKRVGLNQEDLLTFDDLDLELIADPEQRAQMKKLKAYLQKWAKRFKYEKKKNLTFCGGTGLGKTHIAKCLAGELVRLGVNVCFLSAFAMNQRFFEYHTGSKSEKMDKLQPLLYADVLVIDDLGTEPLLKNVTTNYLTLVISERERMGLPIIVTTNLMPDAIFDRYNERIYSRLASKQNGQIFHLEGNDLRLLQNEAQKTK